jgi:hypothetical protein
MVAAGATLGPPRGAGDRLLSAAAVVAAFVYGAATIVGLLAAWLLAETAAGRTRLVIPPDAPDTLIGLLDRFNGPIILWGVMFPVSAAVLELAARARRGILDVARAAWALGPAGVTRLKLLVAALAGLVGAIVAFGVKPG